MEDSRGNLWITSTDWSCLYEPAKRNSENGGFTYFENESGGVLIGGFQEGADGQIWMQNAEGIHRYNNGEFVAVEDRDYNHRNQWTKADGDLWFGVDNGVELSVGEKKWGVYRLHEDKFTFLEFPDVPASETNRFYALTSKAMQTQDGKIWFGTFEAAFGFDGEDFEFLGRERMGRTDDPRHIGYRGYHLDRRDNLWFADNGAGVFVFDGKEVLHFTAHHKLRDEDTDGKPLDRSFSIHEDADGNIWIGTAYSGIWRYQPSTDDPLRKGSFTNFGPEQGFPCTNVWTIYQKRDGELLFAGEKPGGIYRFNGESFELAL